MLHHVIVVAYIHPCYLMLWLLLLLLHAQVLLLGLKLLMRSYYYGLRLY